MGALCGTSKQTIFKYETGVVSNIPIQRLEALAQALQVPLAYLIEDQKDAAARFLPEDFLYRLRTAGYRVTPAFDTAEGDFRNGDGEHRIFSVEDLRSGQSYIYHEENLRQAAADPESFLAGLQEAGAGDPEEGPQIRQLLRQLTPAQRAVIIAQMESMLARN